jgi:hypothetical protein
MDELEVIADVCLERLKHWLKPGLDSAGMLEKSQEKR